MVDVDLESAGRFMRETLGNMRAVDFSAADASLAIQRYRDHVQNEILDSLSAMNETLEEERVARDAAEKAAKDAAHKNLLLTITGIVVAALTLITTIVFGLLAVLH